MTRIKDGRAMIAAMSPVLQDGRFVFVSTDVEALSTRLAPQAIASFAEAEGMSFILPEDVAVAEAQPVEQVMRQITLNVFSDLEGVGLTAGVSTALADAGIAANVVAAFHHDHVFVPADRAEEAMEVLQALQQAAQGEGGV